MKHLNPAVSPAVESIVRHCLEPQPSRRYQAARELHEDLRRQVEHRPLKYAAEPSPWERVRKWTRRHPRVSSSTVVGILAALVILAVRVRLMLRVRHLGRLKAEQRQQTGLEATATLRRLHHDLRAIEALLGSHIPELEREQQDEGDGRRRGCSIGTGSWNRPTGRRPPWSPPWRPNKRQQLREEMGELLLLLAGASARRAQPDLALHQRAGRGVLPRGRRTACALATAPELARSVGRDDEAGPSSNGPRRPGPSTPRPLPAPAHRISARGTPSRILARLHEASRLQGDNFSVWLILGHCHFELGKPMEAIECYAMAGTCGRSPWPPCAGAWRSWSCGTIDRAQPPSMRYPVAAQISTEPYYNRALAKYRLRDLAVRAADLTHLLEDPKPPLRGYLLRAKIRG